MHKASSIFDGATDEFLESIGQEVLAHWTSDVDSDTPGEVSETLHALLATPLDDTGLDWSERVHKLLETMTPSEFASHGRSLCLFLLQRGDRLLETSVTEETTMKNDDDNSISHIPPPTKPEATEAYPEFPQWLPTV